jgi:large subunit ribosomal protein L1
MGKIRVKTIGIEEDEKDQKKKAKERAEAKRIEAAKKLGQETKKEAAERQAIDVKYEVQEETNETNEVKADDKSDEKDGEVKKTEKKESKYKAKTSRKTKPHSAAYAKVADLVDKSKKYTLSEALEILPKLKRTKFDETVELHINTNEKSVSGSITLPHGTGKQTKVAIADQTQDPKKVEDLIKKITAGQIDFDILIATPDTMPKLAVVARFLGPRGLMPNPKNGTIHPKPTDAAKKFEGGQINFKTEAKAPIIHLTVGKVSFGEKQLQENIKTVLTAVQNKNIKNVTLKSTMSPGIKLAV